MRTKYIGTRSYKFGTHFLNYLERVLHQLECDLHIGTRSNKFGTRVINYFESVLN